MLEVLTLDFGGGEIHLPTNQPIDFQGDVGGCFSGDQGPP